MSTLAALPLTHHNPEELPLHTISLLVRNQPGVLVRVALVFSRRGYNIESLVVSPGVAEADSQYSRMTVTCRGEASTLEQIIKQLFKLIDVVKISELHPADSIERELLLATVKAAPEVRSQILELAQVFEGRILGVGHDEMTVSLDGHPSKIDDFEELLRPYGIVELQRTGRVALPKLERTPARLRSVRPNKAG